MRSSNVKNSPLSTIPYAYHFDASLYALYLRKFSEKLGVNRIEGLVEQVMQDPATGFITGIQLQDGVKVEGDFFIDCSGSVEC